MRHFKSLDIVRTLLALAVAAGHYFWVNGIATYYPRSFFLAVDFFFLLSGFVLTQSVLRDRSKSTFEFIRTFMTKRVFRLYPLYILVGCWAYIYYGVQGQFLTAYMYLINLLLLQGTGVAETDFVASSTISIAWSISVELWGGLLFMTAVFMLRRSIWAVVAMCVIVAALNWYVLICYSPGFMDITIHRFFNTVAYGFVRGMLGFALGTICFLAFAKFGDMVSAKWATFAEVVLLSTYSVMYLFPDHWRPLEYFAPAMLALILFVFATERGFFAKVLSSERIAFARPLSYSIYLFHPTLLYIFNLLGVPYSHRNLPIFLAILVVVSLPLYHLIEKPFIYLGRRLLNTRPVLVEKTGPQSNVA